MDLIAGDGLRERLQETLGDGYVLEQELSAGMGRVFVATEARLGRRVVVKVLRPELTETISAERFRREIQVAARLQQANIVPILSADARGPLAYYIMPYVDGESVRHRLASGWLPLADALSILRDVARALAYAHAHGVVHCDIKPENILLSGGTAVVTDFGIAKAVSESQTAGTGTLTPLGFALGTPAYMAPEQATGDPVDGRADLYSWGVVAYEVLAGVHPYAQHRSAQALIAAHLAEPAPSVRHARTDCPVAVSSLIARCMEKSPSQRPQSAVELAAELATATAPSADVRQSSPRHRVVERTFRLTERVCRYLDRASLDPRVIGDDLHYLDNQVNSDVLVCWVPGTGQDQEAHREAVEAVPYRAIAVTLLGFEPRRHKRLTLPLGSHMSLVRELLLHVARDTGTRLTVVVGFSSGGDIALRLPEAAASERLSLAGVLSLGCNVSLESCFATRLLARIKSDSDDRLLADLRQCGAGARTVEEWINIHGYLVQVFRKFQADVAPLRRFAADIIAPFEARDDAFISIFKSAGAHSRVVRCVFEDRPIYNRVVETLRLRNLDEGVLGERYREDSLVIEPGTDHFELAAPEHWRRHLDEIVETARAATYAELSDGAAQ